MSRPRHQAFLDLEETLAARLRNAWSRYWTPLSREILNLCSQGQFDAAHRLAESIDLAPLFDRSRTFARTVGMSALLLGASRLRSPRQSRVAKQPPLRELDSFLRQTEAMLARNASQSLRQMAHEWVNQEEAKLLKGDYPGHPFRGNQYVDLGGGVSVSKQRAGDGLAYVITVPSDDPANVEIAGHISGFDQFDEFQVYSTEINAGHTKLRGTGLYQKAMQAVADQYKNGAYTYDWWSSTALKKALAKMPTYRKDGDKLRVLPAIEKADWREEDHPRGKTTPESTPGSFRPIQYWANEQAAAAFDGFVKAPRTEGIAAAEEAWEGGVADFGDKEAAHLIQAMPGYFDYRSHLEDAARKTLGDSFTVYRLMTPAQLEEWQQTGDVGPVAVTFSRHFADRFRNFAGFKPGAEFVLVEIQASPESIVMMGKEEEQEIVIDSTHVSGDTLKVIPSNFVKSEVAKLDTGADRNQVKINVAGKNYFGLAASVQVSRMSAFGFLLEAAESGVTNYRVDAVLDERTCEVCRHMDGTVFPVEQGLQQAQLIMDTEDPEALKEIAPFYAQNKAALAQLGTYTIEDLIHEGMHLPPYHPLCRCILTPTDEKADLHPTQQADRIALASQTLYGEGDGVRLTRDLFGIEQPEEEAKRRLGDVVPDMTPEETKVMEWLQGVLEEPGYQFDNKLPPVEEVADWVHEVVQDWLTQPSAGVPPAALITPTPFEGTTIPQQYARPFEPSRLAQLAQARWPWLAGILGWLALGHRLEPVPEDDPELVAEEELAEEERDERNELREDRRP